MEEGGGRMLLLPFAKAKKKLSFYYRLGLRRIPSISTERGKYRLCYGSNRVDNYFGLA